MIAEAFGSSANKRLAEVDEYACLISVSKKYSAFNACNHVVLLILVTPRKITHDKSMFSSYSPATHIGTKLSSSQRATTVGRGDVVLDTKVWQ